MFSAILAMTLLAAPPAGNLSLDFPIRKVGPWTVFGGRQDGGEARCIMTTKYEDGTNATVSLSQSNPEFFYFSFSNPAWAEVPDGANVPLTVKMGGHTFSYDATTSVEETGNGFIFGEDLDDGFVASFSFSRDMEIQRDGKTFLTATLGGTKRAIATLAVCMGRLNTQ